MAPQAWGAPGSPAHRGPGSPVHGGEETEMVAYEDSDDEMPRDVDVSTNATVREQTWRRVVSIRTVVTLLCLFGIACSVLSAESLGEMSCDKALEDTKYNADNATTLLRNAAQTSLETLSSNMLGYSSIGIMEMIEASLLGSMREIDTLKQLMQVNLRGVPINSTAYWNIVARDLWYTAASLSNTSASVAVGIMGNSFGLAYFNMNPSSKVVMGTAMVARLAVHGNASLSTASVAMPMTGGVLPLPQFPVRQFKLAPEDLQGMLVSEHIDYYTPTFSNINPQGNYIGVSLTIKLPDPTGSSRFMAGLCFLSLRFIDQFLRGVVANAQVATPGSEPRIYMAVATSWLARAEEAAGRDPTKYEQKRLLVGVSNGNGTERYSGFSDLTGVPSDELQRPLKDVEATDSIISGVATAINGLYEDFELNFQTLQIDRNGTQEGHVVGCRRLTSHGMDMWVVFSIDAYSVFGKIREAEAALAAEITKKRNDVEEEIAKDRETARLIMVGIAVALVAVSIVVSYLVIAPIKKMQAKMSLVAGMHLETIELEPTSLFFELRRMQVDFRRMVENLVEFRAYVPSSVLDSGSDGPAKVITPPTGKVALVFTDIQGSTALWRASAVDMNDAMEMHNDVMRQVCLKCEGYEVKTIGDAFMVSFPCPISAAKFALAVQYKLANKPWPAGLKLTDAGLIVRIGINYGPTIAEKNPVTGRVDYRGSTVNLASRVEAKARGGTTCITGDMKAAIEPFLQKLGNPVIASHGKHELKGLGAGHELFLLVNASQKSRLVGQIGNLAGSVSVNIGNVTHRSTASDDTGSVISNAAKYEKNNKLNGKTALYGQRSSVTVAVCRLNDTKEGKMFESSNIMIRAAAEAAQATDGVVGNVTGRTLTVVWNATKKCVQHSTAALTFAQELLKLKGMLQVGLATGTMLHGNVGTRTSRFVTTFGTPLEAASAMTDHAKMFGVYCLYADCTTDNRLQSEATLRSCVRLVDVWHVSLRAFNTHIYEVNLSRLASALSGWGGGVTESTQDDTSVEAHSRAVAAAMSEHTPTRLRELCDSLPDDRVLRRVLDMIEHSRPTQGYRCKVSFSRVPYAANYEEIGGCLEP